MIKRNQKKKERNISRREYHVFKRKTTFILFIYLFFLCKVVVAQENSFSWLYDNNRRLIADTTILMDIQLEKFGTEDCFNNNPMLLLNRINGNEIVYQSNANLRLILNLTLTKIDSVSFVIDDVGIYKTIEMDDIFLEQFLSIRESLKDLKFYMFGSLSRYSIHLPVKIISTMVKEKSEIGIDKKIKNGWLCIEYKYLSVPYH